MEDASLLLEISQSVYIVEDYMFFAGVIKDGFEGGLVRKGSE